MSQLLSLEKEAPAIWDSIPVRPAAFLRGEDSYVSSLEDFRRRLQALCELIETYSRLSKVHDDSEESTTPCLLQRVCLGREEEEDFVLEFLLKGGGQCVQLLQPTEQYSAASSLMWCSLLYPSRHTQGFIPENTTNNGCRKMSENKGKMVCGKV